MAQDRAYSTDGSGSSYPQGMATTHYALLKIHPSASVKEIRQAYRELSKLYHPDTTQLPTAIATAKFQQLNEAYATLTSEERRAAYNLKIRYSSVSVVQPLPSLHQPAAQSQPGSSSAYIDATDRPLSPGELFALFILGLTFVGCLCLAIAIGLTRGDTLIQPTTAQPAPPAQQVITQPILVKGVTDHATPQKALTFTNKDQ
ncbi:J domain-containing protein [Leptolyngbyaceae cyanobacterium UHCC 1019]